VGQNRACRAATNNNLVVHFGVSLLFMPEG
jgi:hypothetical protein